MAAPCEDTGFSEYANRGETYLRQFAESMLRRVADGKLTADECSSRVHAVAAAFEGTGVLDAELASRVHGDTEVALAARSPDGETVLHLGRRPPFAASRGASGVSPMLARSAAGPARGGNGSHQGSFGGIEVVPAGTVLRPRATGTPGGGTHGGGDDESGGEEDIYLLGFVWTARRAWLTVAVRTDGRPARRPASPPSARNAGARRLMPSTFAGGGMTAVDDAGRHYRLAFSGGGGKWFLGRLALNPAPPPGIAWLDVRCGAELVRVDLAARAPAPEVSTVPLTASRAEAYLLQRAETLLIRPGLAAAEAAGIADVVPALRAAGALSGNSPVPGQVAALCERLGAPGRPIAPPGPLPERWTDFLAATRAGNRPWTEAGLAGWGTFEDAGVIDAARLAAALPVAGGTTVVLAGLISGTGGITIIFGALYLGPEPAGETDSLSMWVRDDAGGWHTASIIGWSNDSHDGVSFRAVVLPPLSPATSRIDFYVTVLSGTGPSEQIQAAVALEWWSTQ